LHVSIVALPEAMPSTLNGLFDTLNGIGALPELFDALTGVGAAPGGSVDLSAVSPFRVEIVGREAGAVELVGGLPQAVHRPIGAIAKTDILIVPSLLVPGGAWQKGRYPDLVRWVGDMHARGTVICSACSGIYLLAEAGLFDGQAATIHWTYAPFFTRIYPDVPIFPEHALVVSGDRDELISCGASTSWHDLVLYLVARFQGRTVAQAMAKFYALQWHEEGLGPYVIFTGPTGHGDAVVEDAQRWLADNFPVGNPVEQTIRRSGLSDRSFSRRFAKATGLTPIAYVQRLRVEDAKRRLERSTEPVDEIGWRVGYEDPAFFRRLFRRITGLSPAAYRKRFRGPGA
jgi:transcriptional regulator GlxA family with amidase domain